MIGRSLSSHLAYLLRGARTAPRRVVLAPGTTPVPGTPPPCGIPGAGVPQDTAAWITARDGGGSRTGSDTCPSGIGPAPDARLFTGAVAAAGLPVVLDAGFGDGRLRPQLAPVCHWIGVELDAARVRAGAARGWAVARADITSGLPFAAESVDGVVLSCVLNTVAPLDLRAAVVREVSRVLRPGGVVWVRDFVRLSEPDSRVGTVVSGAHWAAMRRRYALGAELTAWVSGLPADRFSPGTFPAFDIGPGEDGSLFRTHRYTADRFRASVRSGHISVPFLACHPTHGELCSEWRALGEIVTVRCGSARTRGGEVLPADDIVVRKRGYRR